MSAINFLFLDPSKQFASKELLRGSDSGASLAEYHDQHANRSAVLVKGLTNQTIITINDNFGRSIVGCTPLGGEDQWVHDFAQELQLYQDNLEANQVVYPQLSLNVLFRKGNFAGDLVSTFAKYKIQFPLQCVYWYDYPQAVNVGFCPDDSITYAFMLKSIDWETGKVYKYQELLAPLGLSK